MLFMSPWADVAIAVLSAGQCPGEAARALQAPPSVLQQLMRPVVNLHCLRVDPWQCELLPALNAIVFYKSIVFFSRNS